MTAIETRILSGASNRFDAEWLEFLSSVFRDVPFSGLVAHGMSASDARRLVNVLALTNRITHQEQPQ